ncbi:hypothetical protein Spp001_43 [Shewanella phage Spp001]|uniref:Uncharacterized protein n=1 Tax=Shewanella phage Spp001 TaxID=1445859 RepID=W6E9I6_9CAUD|nr:hypothetical protein Spp001_43 [Shewanella phage Spp001]AHJ10551.1 hypothetical protein Spp001_43 [Shewanella phage Spp001]
MSYKGGYNPKDDPMYYRAWNPQPLWVIVCGFMLSIVIAIAAILFASSGALHRWSLEQVKAQGASAPQGIDRQVELLYIQGEPYEVQDRQYHGLRRTA